MDDDPVFNYVASIQGREFFVTIFENKMSQWDDLSSCGLARRLQDDPSDGVISVPVNNDIFEKAMEMAQKEKTEEARTGHLQAVGGDSGRYCRNRSTVRTVLLAGGKSAPESTTCPKSANTALSCDIRSLSRSPCCKCPPSLQTLHDQPDGSHSTSWSDRDCFNEHKTRSKPTLPWEDRASAPDACSCGHSACNDAGPSEIRKTLDQCLINDIGEVFLDFTACSIRSQSAFNFRREARSTLKTGSVPMQS